MISPRLRAGLVIGAVMIASAIAGAAADRAFVSRTQNVRREGGRPRRASGEQDAARRAEMLNRITQELSLSATQRAGIDSVFRVTDSSLRAVRGEMEPRIQQVFERHRREMNARLDSAQRVKYAQFRARGRGGRGGGRSGGAHSDSQRSGGSPPAQ